MSVVEGQTLFRSREDILADLMTAIASRIPDVYLGQDGQLRMFFEVIAGVEESVFAAQEILSEDMFVQSANPVALDRHGIQFGISRKQGTFATGTLRFSGAGGSFIPMGTDVAYQPGTSPDDQLLFRTIADLTLPNPGIPTAPVLSDLATAGNLSGTMEYAITFVTAVGETQIGEESDPITVSASRVHLASIPLGGVGTTARKIYRSEDGSTYALVATISDNTTTTYDDNIADGSLGSQPPAISSAERASVAAQSDEPGAKYNVLPGTILSLVDVPQGVTEVFNEVAFTGGSDPEDTETFRLRLLDAVRAPGTGSALDLKSWAENIDGIESATVFPNDNLGVFALGHTTVRVSGFGGSIPTSDLVSAVNAALQARDLANIAIHTSTFTAVLTDVTVSVSRDVNFSLADVTPSVQQSISDYINGLQVGETLRVSGIVDAVFGLPGITDVDVITPTGNLSTGPTSKRTPGTILVS